MGRRCSVVGCSGSVGLHWFPQDAKLKRQWLRVIGLDESCEISPQAGICKEHFSRDAFANMMAFDLGFAKRLILKSDAVPTLGLPRMSQRPPTLLPRSQPEVRPQPETKGTREIGCQTDPVVRENTSDQDDLTPCKRCKAPSQVSRIDTGTMTEIPFPESPRARAAPLKRKRCEVSASDHSFYLNNSSSSVNCTSSTTDVPPHKVKKYIVHEDQLLGLFRSCPVCSTRCSVDTVTIGTHLQVTQRCPLCKYYNQWFSQPMVNGIPSGNLQLCAAVLFSGFSFTRISKFLRAFNIQGLSEQYFNDYQAKLLIPTVSWQWKLEQDAVIREAIDGGTVTLGSDMRMLSPGHSPKCGSYTMMDLTRNKVIDIQLVQSAEVGNSVRLEEEGLERSLNMLEGRGVKVEAIVTDRHVDLQKVLRVDKKEITHYFDPWHMATGIGEKMDELSKKKSTQDVGLWRKHVVNHLYWSASTSSSGQEAVAKWTSVANHIQNIHTHNNALFPRCLHESVGGSEAGQWLKPSTEACEKLTAILLTPRFLKDLEKISPVYHSTTVEAFHSLVTTFIPKSVCFSVKGTLSRMQIAALHYNENAAQSHSTGEFQYVMVYPKHKGVNSARTLKTKPTSVYVDKLMTLLFEFVVEDPLPYQEFTNKVPVPEPLCAQNERLGNGRL